MAKQQVGRQPPPALLHHAQPLAPCTPLQALSGHARITDAGVEAVAGMGQLQHLELRLGGPDAQG